MTKRFYFKAADILHDVQCALDIALTFSACQRAMIAKFMVLGIGIDFWATLPMRWDEGTNLDAGAGGFTLAFRLPGAGVVVSHHESW